MLTLSVFGPGVLFLTEGQASCGGGLQDQAKEDSGGPIVNSPATPRRTGKGARARAPCPLTGLQTGSSIGGC